MAPRSELQALLKAIPGVAGVYFQKPASMTMEYPAIVYKLDDMDVRHADNDPYLIAFRYLVTVIDQDPDSPVRGEVAKLRMCTFDRHYTADQLNHYVFNLYF